MKRLQLPALAEKPASTTVCRAQQRSAPGHLRDNHAHQRGIVLIIALIMLGLISLLAMLSVRNATSTESVAGNVRTTELATQAAELALRHCEASVLAMLSSAAGTPSTYATTFDSNNVLPVAIPAKWQDTANWDSEASAAYVLPLKMVNQPGIVPSTYKRPPECMVEPLAVTPPGAGAVVSISTSFVITARGFGPEVPAATPDRRRPVGTEVWVQSQIDLQ